MRNLTSDLHRQDGLEELNEWLQKIKWDVIGLYGARRKAEGIFKLKCLLFQRKKVWMNWRNRIYYKWKHGRRRLKNISIYQSVVRRMVHVSNRTSTAIIHCPRWTVMMMILITYTKILYPYKQAKVDLSRLNAKVGWLMNLCRTSGRKSLKMYIADLCTVHMLK